jgi:hypothetical protein
LRAFKATRVLGLSDCERVRAGVLAQPVNAGTSMAYLAAAAGVLVPALRGGGVHRLTLMAYAASLAAVGVGSLAYHGPQPWWARRIHDRSITAALACALLVAATAQPPTPEQALRQACPLAALTALAATAYRAGRTRSRWCDPDSRLQMHGLWHLLSAGSALTVAWILGEQKAQRDSPVTSSSPRRDSR